MYHQAPPQAPLCQHIHSDNRRCGSPALRGQPFCYFHSSSRSDKKKKTVSVPVLDNPASIQLALTQVISRLLAGELDPQIATIAINGLRIASVNQKHMRIEWSLAENELTPAMAAELLAAEETADSQDQDESTRNVVLRRSEAEPKDLCISAGTTTEAAEVKSADPVADHQITSSSVHPIANGPMAPSPDGTIELTHMLSNTKVKALRRIMRQGPRHPLFKSAARQLEKHGIAVVNARNLAACGD